MVNKSSRTTNIYYPLKGALGRKYLSKELFCKPHMENPFHLGANSFGHSYPTLTGLCRTASWQTAVTIQLQFLKGTRTTAMMVTLTSSPLMLLLLKKHYSRKAYAANSEKESTSVQFTCQVHLYHYLKRNFKREGWREKTKLIFWLEKGTYNVSKKS